MLETEKVADSKMASLLKSFASLKSEVSLINGVVFTKHTILPMVSSSSVWKRSVLRIGALWHASVGIRMPCCVA